MASPSQPVHPLRIQKGTQSPTKNNSRPLSELDPTEKRRNSPSFPQSGHKKMASLNGDSSPFQSSPFSPSEVNSSPRLFWQGREPTTPSRFNAENLFAGREGSPSPTRRTSIERLQKASRVKNSTMYAREQKQEYDPASVPMLERPLAKQLQGNAYGGAGLDGLRSAERGNVFGHKRQESSISMYSPTNKTPVKSGANGQSPSKNRGSPTKSSMAMGRFNGKASFDSESGAWPSEPSGDEKELPNGQYLRRHAKSVTFDAAPPQVNEYEMTTPDISSIGTGSREGSYESDEDEEEDSYNMGDSLDQDDSFDASLEDTDKTPVVGPDDWRHTSPGDHNSGIMSGRYDDPFTGPGSSPMPESRPSSSTARPKGARTDSMGSNGEHRPLPPLPGMNPFKRSNSSSSVGQSAAAERASQRHLPSPPAAAAISKSDIQGMTGGKMSLEERLRLMMIQDEEKPKTEAEKQRERRMRRGGPRDRNSQTPEREQAIPVHEDEDTIDDLPGLGSYQLPPRISRESILRKVNKQESFSRDSDYNFNSSPAPSSPDRPLPLDPDTPIPSTEDHSFVESEMDEDVEDYGENDDSIIIKREPEDEDEHVDVYSIPDIYHRTESRLEDYDNGDEIPAEEDAESQYSDPLPTNPSPQFTSDSAPDDEGPPTPRAISPEESTTPHDPIKESDKNALPEFTGFMSANDFGMSLQHYMTPSPPPPKDEIPLEPPKMAAVHEFLQRPETPQEKPLPASKPEYDGSGWGPEEEEEEEEEEEFESGTPDSVIRHPLPPSPARASPVIPEKVATIKASGSKLKTRPSATPADLMVMRDMRRNVSGENPSIPPIPERHRSRPSLTAERELEPTSPETEDFVERHPSFKKKSLTLDIGSDLSLSLDKDFDRVIEAQKRGYLMRQNTKLVVASSDGDVRDDFSGTRSAGNSPVKKDRPQSWTVEPWNGQTRKNSSRGDRANPRKKSMGGTAPPMPGQDSVVTGLGILTEEGSIPEPIPEEGGERGRLFVKVIGVKDLDMPLPKNEQTWFSLTLDNGVHCVTTAWLELGRNAPIGQEFELVVPNELEFQLTLNAKLVKPTPKRVVESPTKAHKVAKPSTFSRVFASPKKRKELEMRMKEEEERAAQQKQREAQAKKASSHPTAWDLLSPLAAEDGSFGRSYVCLKDHEAFCYGRPYIVDVACFNEWATEEVAHSSSVKSKRGTTNVQRRAPYKVAKLQLQLLFVPKPKGATDDDMPKSMNSCIREMEAAEVALARNWEGTLSQQGGDCPYWRRRYFKLVGSKLTAYHESTRQPRATINLANAGKLIDDRRALTQKETSGKSGKRRKSGFAEDEEGYMFVEEGFRIRFNNGEVIDFYADSATDKEGWMKVLDACIGKESAGAKGGWCEMVLKREKSLAQRNQEGTVRKTSRHNRTKSMIV